MKISMVYGIVASIAVSILFVLGVFPLAGSAAAEKDGPMLAHMVYFSLKDDSEEAKQKLVAACNKYLSDHPGTVFFGAGTLAGEYDRPVNDRDFDVALHLVFRDKAAHDTYQTSPSHLKFIEENRETWKNVRVFDSYLQASAE